MRFEAHAELWDVRNGCLDLAADAEAEAERSQTRSPLWLAPEGALDDARTTLWPCVGATGVI